jgi:hypothetical protein
MSRWKPGTYSASSCTTRSREYQGRGGVTIQEGPEREEPKFSKIHAGEGRGYAASASSAPIWLSSLTFLVPPYLSFPSPSEMERTARAPEGPGDGSAGKAWLIKLQFTMLMFNT